LFSCWEHSEMKKSFMNLRESSSGMEGGSTQAPFRAPALKHCPD
jgi:hypothetical protein